jgi:uncharacterized protein YciI
MSMFSFHRRISVKSLYQLSAVNNFNSESLQPKTFILQYKYVENMVEKRKSCRELHLKFAQDYLEKGLIVSAGAFIPDLEGALFIFKSTKSEIENFVQSDPYFINGLVPDYSIKEWNVVIGKI